ncbi:hypothetical protein G6F57_023044 [Rhizopus arrhizus]|nr:hypothetical protein G6F57_023044 [Rhizopus arrhizus]KAG1433699.1 hypothetical protein G6F56_014541 [Rhizopus delemar]
MAKAVARQLVAIQRDHARIQPGFDPRAPGLLRDPGVSQFGGGHGVLAGQATQHNAGGGIFRDGRTVGKAHTDS